MHEQTPPADFVNDTSTLEVGDRRRSIMSSSRLVVQSIFSFENMDWDSSFGEK